MTCHRRRLERLVHAARERASRDNRPVEEMTDAELIAVVRRAFPWVSDPPTDAELDEVANLTGG